ncbi:DUF6985 domain-containing protein [Hymenobacter canadensis]|uniref:DUF6985 domain-containing protein n=1 Tax=Hymenobacter canadensis TaxID=2999067 RepID=A0ABY7LSS6_9BACT|nr:hypothetical protein [Hymenobacter canadensis]WBA43002.1 hypothetical protein O3303_05415 [Hymenobacter canadensis]
MDKFIQSTVVGPMLQDADLDDWWQSQPVAVPFFDNQPVSVVLSGVLSATAADLADMDECLTHFLALGAADRLALSDLVWANYQEVVEAVGEDLDIRIDTPADVWAHVHPREIHISWRDRRDEDIYLSVECACDWEIEHGLQLVFRRGRMLTRVSQCDGQLTEADANDWPDEKDALLSAYNATFTSPKNQNVLE